MTTHQETAPAAVFESLADYGVVPVIVINDAKDALPLADALLEGGLPVAEITLRTPAALDAIEQIATHRPEVLVGAGTLIDEEQVLRVKSAGASLALSPGCDDQSAFYAGRHDNVRYSDCSEAGMPLG